MTLNRPLLLACALVILAGGCSGHPGSGGDGGGGNGDGGQVTHDGGGGGGDGGSTDGGATDGGGGGCTQGGGQCGSGKYCDATGNCVAGGKCSPSLGTANCNYPSGGAGCGGTTSEACYCDPADSTCKPRLAMCAACTSDVQCGSNANYYTTPMGCATFNGSKVCLVPAGQQACPRGYVADTSGTWCVPNSGACGSASVCNTDADCPTATPICDKVTGTCKAACTFDLKTGASTCPTNQVCDQDGHCRAQCDPNNDQCPKINPSYVCKQDTGGVYRCRINGCLGDSECPAGTAPYVGYCDLSTNTCVADNCRPSKSNPTTLANPDCTSGYKCNSQGQCIPMTCKEAGGTAVACGIDAICCGDPLSCPANPTPDPNGAPGCAVAPNPPWCQSCSQNSDCTYTGSKADPQDKDLCFNSKCANTCKDSTYCPRGFECRNVEAGCKQGQSNQCGTAGQCVDDGQFGKACKTTADCGSSQNVTCKTNPSTGTLECYQPMYLCDCGQGGTANAANCPSGSRCTMIAPTKYRCVVSKVCLTQTGTCQ